MPAGTIFKVIRAGTTAAFQSIPCSDCGFSFHYTSKAKEKFDDVVWLAEEKILIPEETKC